MALVGLIPARGGSKGIPKKCIAPCNGRPLLFYTAQAALESKLLDNVIVSTDDSEIAQIAQAFGVRAPFLRPSAISGDHVPMIEVVEHALSWLEQSGSDVSGIVLLQPTSPLRKALHIDEAISLFLKNEVDSVVSVVEVPHQYSPESVMTMGEDGKLVSFLGGEKSVLRRQDKAKVLARNGPAIVVSSTATIRRGMLYGKNMIGYKMDKFSSVDVDDFDDLRLAELILRDGAS